MFLKWLKAAAVRAAKTFFQVFAGMITLDAMTGMADVDWKHIASVAAVSAIYSLATSVAGLPEVEE